MSNENWALLAEVRSNFEAERLVEDLAADGIPAIIKSEATGLFGPGFSGAMPQPVRVYVPASALEDARDFLPDE